MSVLIKIVCSRVGFFSSLCTRLAGTRSLTGRCSCWAVDWKCCHRERGKGEVAWSRIKWIGNRGSILSPALCCHSAQCGGVCLDTGLLLNPLLPWLGSLQRQLFSPYGWDSAPPPLLSNDAFLTDTQREPLIQEGRSTQGSTFKGTGRKSRGHTTN